MIQSELFQIAAESHWLDLGEGIQRQVFGYDDRIMMVKVKFEQGAVVILHQHPHTQLSYVESGVFETTIGNEKKDFKQGDGFYIPSNEVHGVVCKRQGYSLMYLVLIGKTSCLNYKNIQNLPGQAADF